MNRTVISLTARSLLGRRRAILLVIAPLLLLAFALAVRLLARGDVELATAHLLGDFALGTLLPLVSLLAGTGSIAPEIDDGSIVYLLSKPLSRRTIILSKLVVAIAAVLVFAAVPVLLAGLIVVGWSANLALGYAIGAAVAGVAYCALFVLLSVLTSNAVIIGLVYALIWETTIAGLVPGARALSVRQWALALIEKIVGARATDLGVTSDVGLTTAVVLLVILTLGATWYAGDRLRALRLTTDD